MARVTLGPDERIALHVMIRAIARGAAARAAAAEARAKVTRDAANARAIAAANARAAAIKEAAESMVLADAYVNPGPFADPVDTAPVDAVEPVAAPIDEPPKVAATAYAMFMSPEYLADAYVNRTGPFADPVDTAPVDAVEPVAAPIDEPPKVAATEYTMFTSPEYLADLEALKARMAARAAVQKDEPFMVTTYRELTDDERRSRLLHVMDVARELPAWRNDEPCGHSPRWLDHRVIELLANDPTIGEWTRAEYERIGHEDFFETDLFGTPACGNFGSTRQVDVLFVSHY